MLLVSRSCEQKKPGRGEDHVRCNCVQHARVLGCAVSTTTVFQYILRLFLLLFSQINDARGLFKKLADQCLLENNSFLRQLLQTIRREDLLRLLGADNRQLMETDASPLLSGYR